MALLNNVMTLFAELVLFLNYYSPFLFFQGAVHSNAEGTCKGLHATYTTNQVLTGVLNSKKGFGQMGVNMPLSTLLVLFLKVSGHILTPF